MSTPKATRADAATTGSKLENVLKLSVDRLQDLTSSPESLPLRPVDSEGSQQESCKRPSAYNIDPASDKYSGQVKFEKDSFHTTPFTNSPILGPPIGEDQKKARNLTIETGNRPLESSSSPKSRPWAPQRAVSTPTSARNPQSPHKSEKIRPSLKLPEASSRFEGNDGRRYSSSGRPLPSPMPASIPLPPVSIPTYLQLELSSQRPSPLYIHRSANSDFPYESSRAKTERLLNFLLLPPHLESVLWFGTVACLDSWLYIFTILPLRLLKSFYLLTKSWGINFATEVNFVSNFVYNGAGRMWTRRRGSLPPNSTRKTSGPNAPDTRPSHNPLHGRTRYHQRTKSVPSTLLPDDKADMLKGLLIISTCLILLRLDASRMYHWVRGQAAIKLYVIYNILEVCDRLFSAIGQDVLECLFSRETLERKADGHSKILRPFWLFVLALVYCVIHATALFYQVVTLNVAVNSYSNALITLLMSNQFVEIKGTVFKKFEKENLFQLTCADVVERFQLWHMLIIIAARNIVETGGLNRGLAAFTAASSATASATTTSNGSIPLTAAFPPRSASSILPSAFTLLPTMVESITSFAPAVSQVLGPFLVVLGSEMLVDWLKHAYISKFNNTRPAIYDRFLDVLAKDYYTNAFGEQNLTKRLGLPVIPLSCLFIRASVQTYQMFMAAWVPSSSPSSSTSLASIHEDYSAVRSTLPITTGTAISRTVDDIIRSIPNVIMKSSIVTHMTTLLVFLLFFLILLACKLVLGMLLLAFARSRYHSMKLREKSAVHQVEGGRRVGGWGVVEVDEDKRRWIYEDDPAGLRALRERDERERQKQQREKEKGHGVEAFDKVQRYEMVAKRIW
ncbi:eukaryotic membrane protein family-domain-containing protein [Exophiala viscosa]|uniref:eukaryotic membrane protein family-domain-containing protein n=1 Tax=Exophiala viscosa TaxID=2486360 RepID=UPI00219EAD82|nr:eukaryotic membrane protein family-domain-containing protein [Exophiala viscosa]